MDSPPAALHVAFIRRPRAGRHALRGRSRRNLVGIVLAVVSLLALVGVLYRGYPTTWGEKPIFTSAKHNVNYELSRQWIETGLPSYELASWERLPQDLAIALTPRDAALAPDGSAVPKEFPAAIALQSLIMLVDERLVPLMAPILAALAVAGVWLLTKELTRSTGAAFVAAAVFASLPALLAVSLRPTAPDLGGVAALLLGTWATVRSDWQRRAGSKGSAAFWLASAGGLLALAIAFRYTYALYVGMLALVVVVRFWRAPTALLAGVLAGSTVLGLTAFYHSQVYGSPLETGYSLGQDLVTSTVNPSRSWPFGFDMQVFLDHMRLYVFRPEMVWVVAIGSLGMLLFLSRRTAGRGHFIILPALLFSMFILVYQAGRNTYGSTFYATNASFTRYLLGSLALLAVFYGAVFWLLPRWWQLALVFITALVVVQGVWVFINERGGVETGDVVTRYVTTRQQILEATDADGLIITRGLDKILWPQRETLTASYLVSNPEPIDLESERFYDQVPTSAELASIALRLCELNRTVYVFNEGFWLTEGLEVLEQDLQALGLTATYPSAARFDLVEIHCRS